MRIVFLIHSLSAGGAERVTANMANRWAAQGHAVTILTLAASPPHYALSPGVAIAPLGLAAESAGWLAALRANLARIRAVRRVLRNLRPDAAIAMMPASAILLALARLGLPVRAIGSERAFPPRVDIGPAWRWLRWGAYGLLDGVVCQTAKTAAWVAAHTLARRVWVIPNSLTWPIPGHTPAPPPSGLIRPGRKVVISIGRFHPQKDFARLLRLFAGLAADHPDWDLVIVGGGGERPGLESDRAALGLDGRVFLAGEVGNIGDWCAAADIFAFTSRYEGFPNALLEAMACGLPAVSVDCDTGPRDLIRDGVDGRLVPLDDDAAFLAALSGLMADADQRAAMGARAAEVRVRFAEAPIMEKWRDVIEGEIDRT